LECGICSQLNIIAEPFFDGAADGGSQALPSQTDSIFFEVNNGSVDHIVEGSNIIHAWKLSLDRDLDQCASLQDSCDGYFAFRLH
jgi:hypothetical protein